MQQGEYKLVPFLGINTEPLNDQSQDGLCSQIFNLKPKGVEGEPYWVPFEEIMNLSNIEGTPFTYEHGIENIPGAFWQIRNYIGEFDETGSTSLRRLVVPCNKPDRKAIDIIDPIDWSIVKSMDLEDGDYSMSFTRINEISVINLVRNSEPYKIFYLIDDLLVEQGWPEMPRITYLSETESYTEAEVLAGQNGGIPRKDTKQYFMVRWAFRLFDNSFVKHSRIQLVEVPTGLETNSIIPQFTMVGYDEPLENKEFWEAFISGVSVFATSPKNTQKEALDDFAYYEVGFFPFLNNKPMEEWDTPNNPNIIRVTSNFIVWLTQQNLGIDNFTHHRVSANVVDSYNSRVLLGGVSTDFVLPVLSPSTGIIDYINGGGYEAYYTHSTGSRVITAEWFLMDGTPTDQGSAEYENEETTIKAIFTPNAGREFKEISIKEIAFVPVPDLTPDGKLFPIHQYTAQITNDGNLNLEMLIKQSTFNADSNVDPFMIVELRIGDIGGEIDEIILITVNDPGTNLEPYFSFSIQLQTNVLAEFSVFHEVTIKTQSGTFKRVWEDTTETGQRLLFPNILHYPDRRAINYRIVVRNGEDYELALDKKLTQHPSLNFSYVRLFPQEMEHFIGGVAPATTQPDLSVNLINQWDKNRAQASLTDQPFVFEAAASYRVGNREKDSIQAFGVNTIDISQGQFGQYPLYIFSDKSVWALEQSGDPEVAFGRIVPVSTFNSLNNRNAICNAENIIIAADSNYIYSLNGLNPQRVDRPISQDPEYSQFIDGIIMAYHKASDYEEIIFSNANFNYSWFYNLRYSFWYKSSDSYRAFFADQPNIYAITTDNNVKDYSKKDIDVMKPWFIKTRPMNLGSRYFMKRLWNSQIRCELQQSGEPQPLTVKMEAKNEDGAIYTAMEYNMTENSSKDLWIKSKYGSFQTMTISMNGSHTNNGSEIHQIELNFENRYTNRVRR